MSPFASRSVVLWRASIRSVREQSKHEHRGQEADEAVGRHVRAQYCPEPLKAPHPEKQDHRQEFNRGEKEPPPNAPALTLSGHWVIAPCSGDFGEVVGGGAQAEGLAVGELDGVVDVGVEFAEEVAMGVLVDEVDGGLVHGDAVG